MVVDRVRGQRSREDGFFRDARACDKKKRSLE